MEMPAFKILVRKEHSAHREPLLTHDSFIGVGLLKSYSYKYPPPDP